MSANEEDQHQTRVMLPGIFNPKAITSMRSLLYDSRQHEGRRTILDPKFARKGFSSLSSSVDTSSLTKLGRSMVPDLMIADVVPRPLTSRVMEIPIFSGTDRWVAARAFAHAILSNQAAVVEKLTSNMFYEQSFCVAACNMFNSAQLQNLIMQAGYREYIIFQFIEVNCDIEAEYTGFLVRYPSVMQTLDLIPIIEQLDDKASLASLGLLLLLIIKRLSADNAAGFIKSRVKALTNSVGIDASQLLITWDWQRCSSAYTAISSAFGLRKQIFTAIYTAGFRSEDTKTFYHALLSYFAYADMGHITTIIDYLMTEPALMVLAGLNDNERALTEMCQFLSEQGDAAPYARLLMPMRQCTPILSTTLRPLFRVALAIAGKKCQRFLNFKVNPADQAIIEDLHKIVDDYLGLIASVRSIDLVSNKHTLLHDSARIIALSSAFKQAMTTDGSVMEEQAFRL